MRAPSPWGRRPVCGKSIRNLLGSALGLGGDLILELLAVLALDAGSPNGVIINHGNLIQRHQTVGHRSGGVGGNAEGVVFGVAALTGLGGHPVDELLGVLLLVGLAALDEGHGAHLITGAVGGEAQLNVIALGPKSLEDSIIKRLDEVDELVAANSSIKKNIEELFANMKCSYQKVGLVKYDAFNEMGGKLSFSLAMLNGKDDGFVLNAVHSREGCYTYIKEIVGGNSIIVLADEEQEALNMAKEANMPAEK